MFEELKLYARIVVSGPHRSGTTICGAMIAADTGHQELREEAFGFSDEAQFTRALKRERVVLQAPFFAHRLHYLNQIADPLTICVVMMIRDIEDILVSQEKLECAGISQYRAQHFHARLPAPDIVYENWRAQRELIPHWREVQYESLKGHALWAHNRSHFHYRQTA